MTELGAPAERIESSRLVLLANAGLDGFGVNSMVPRSRIIFDAVEADRKRLGEYLPWVDFVKNERDQEAYLSQCEENREKSEGFDYGIYLKNGAYLGNCGIHTVSKSNRRGEIGYWITGRYSGQGYMTEAVASLARACFKSGFHRLEIRCNAENQKSFGVAERLMFRREGELREDCFDGGAWRNTRIYGLLSSEAANLS